MWDMIMESAIIAFLTQYDRNKRFDLKSFVFSFIFACAALFIYKTVVSYFHFSILYIESLKDINSGLEQQCSFNFPVLYLIRAGKGIRRIRKRQKTRRRANSSRLFIF